MAGNWGDAERGRLTAAREEGVPWRKWRPYLSEREWERFVKISATMGLAGFSDEKQRLCFALALWNGRDPILKERLFGLTNAEGNRTDSGMFGGNANWRGPIWMPMNLMVYRGAAAVLRLLRRLLQDRVSDRFPAAHEALRGRPGTREAPNPHLSSR